MEETGRKSIKPCAECGKYEVYVYEINEHPDYRVTCHACNKTYYVDGPDS